MIHLPHTTVSPPIPVSRPTRKQSPLGPRLRRLGFDRSRYDRSTGKWRVRCSQCKALVINGVPCHESGCPNTRRPRTSTED